MRLFFKGFHAMLPITTGVIPFGIVMGTVAADARLSLAQSSLMNIFVYAGAAQLAAVDLMRKDASSFVVIATGLIINLRFLLYSAALSPVVEKSSGITKLLSAYSLTDQSYGVMISQQKNLNSSRQLLEFYLGASLCMFITWHLSALAGFIFGNFAPANWSLDYAVPLSFVALTLPTIKDQKYVYVAIFSSLTSLLFHPLPYRIGLILSAALSITFAIYLSKNTRAR